MAVFTMKLTLSTDSNIYNRLINTNTDKAKYRFKQWFSTWGPQNLKVLYYSRWEGVHRMFGICYRSSTVEKVENR